MQNMSCALTTKQVMDETKDITRRVGWWNLKPGDRIQLCEKCMGRKADEPLVRLIEPVNEPEEDEEEEDEEDD